MYIIVIIKNRIVVIGESRDYWGSLTKKIIKYINYFKEISILTNVRIKLGMTFTKLTGKKKFHVLKAL